MLDKPARGCHQCRKVSLLCIVKDRLRRDLAVCFDMDLVQMRMGALLATADAVEDSRFSCEVE